MNELYITILSLSLSGSLLILLLFALKPLYRERFSKRWQYYIWLVVLLRLVLPFAPESNLMGVLLPQAGKVIEREMAAASTDRQDSKEISFDPPADSAYGQADEPASDPPALSPGTSEPLRQSGGIFSIKDYLLFIWLIGVLVSVVYKITIYRSFSQYVKAGNTEVSDPEILNLLSDLREQTGVKARVEISVNPLLASPLLMGFIRPHIVLPGAETDKKDFQYILLHELTHCKSLDMLYKWLAQIVLCLHWFNPLVHILTRELNKACELACDEALLLSLDADGRKEYGSMLLSALDVPGRYRQSIATVTLGENASQLKERLESIMSFHGKSKWGALAAVCSLFLIAVGTWSGMYASASSLEVPANAANPANLTASVPDSRMAAEDKAELKTETVTRVEATAGKPNITSGSVVLADDVKITSLSINATIGNLTIKRGEQYKIEVGHKLTDHAIYEVKDGVLHYFDDYAGKQINVKNTNKGYDIVITVPSGSAQYERITARSGFGATSVADINAASAIFGSGFGECSLSGIKAGALEISSDYGSVKLENSAVSGEIKCHSGFGSIKLDRVQGSSLETDTSFGGIDIINCTVEGAVTCRGKSGGHTIDGLKAASLSISSQMGGLTVLRSDISNGMNVKLVSGGAEISGDIKGNIAIEKGMGGITLSLEGSKRSDYHIIADGPNRGEAQALFSGLSIDGKSYPYDYDDANTDAPYTMKISSSSGFGEDVAVYFEAK